MTFSLPTKIAERLSSQDNQKIVQIYDQIIELYHELRGTNASADMRRRYQPSVQIQAGAWMSVGWKDCGWLIDQIMIDYDKIDNNISPIFLNLTFVTSLNGSLNDDFQELWGILHEYGINYKIEYFY